MEPVDYTKLSWSERRTVRHQYIKDQGGMCWHCEESLACDAPDSIRNKPIDLRLFPPDFLLNPVHLQHDHTTGMTEGAVHAYCNAVLWQYYGR